MQHLTTAEIGRYVSRAASVDEILAAAHHLDVCDLCRDRAAALVDAEDAAVTRHPRRDAAAPAVEESRSRTLTVVIAVALVIGFVVLALLMWRH